MSFQADSLQETVRHQILQKPNLCFYQELQNGFFV